MRKRLKKKLGKEKCLKCNRQVGIRAYYELKTGRGVWGPFKCVYCDLGYEERIEDY